MKSKKLHRIMNDDKEYLFQNYGRLPVCFVKGEGSCLYDQDNKRYIDFFSGIAVSIIGYGNHEFGKKVHQQVDAVIHTSNWYYNREQVNAAKAISDLTFPGKTLFANSGTEANEAAIKLVRRYGLSQSKKRYKIISFTNSFHGRTFGGMSATAQKKIHEGFGPLVPGFKFLPFNNIESFKREIKKDKNITAVFLELIQGEGGIILADKGFVKEVFTLCHRHNIVTVVDEIQTGIGRTGKPFAYQHYNVVPDIVTMAKGLAGGIPIGAIHAKNYLAEYFDKGRHGSTFGGNHLACAAAAAVLGIVQKKNTMKNVNTVSAYIFEELYKIREKAPCIREIRGIGLHIGIELTKPGMDIVRKALENGLIINCTSGNVIRIMPPLTISLQSVKEGMKKLEKILIEEGKA